MNGWLHRPSVFSTGMVGRQAPGRHVRDRNLLLSRPRSLFWGPDLGRLTYSSDRRESPILRAVNILPWRVRSFLRRKWKRAFHLGGDFLQGESSDRADRMTLLWEQNWPGIEPIGATLRFAYPDRWVRFHSLPDSERYADTDAEREELLRRHRTVLTELRDGSSPESLVIIAHEWGPNDLFGGWTKKVLPGCWPWKSYLDADIQDDEVANVSYFWIAPTLDAPALETLLAEVAQNRADIVITNRDMSWLYRPYDGGADVILPTVADRDHLRIKYGAWLSAHPLGL